MAKQILQSDEARKALKNGIDKVADIVKLTLGPRGRNVALDKSWGGPTITNDGVTIAKEITLADKFENMGASIVKEVAQKTNDKAGDGTTTSIVLFQAMVRDGLKRLGPAVNPMVVREGMEQALTDAVDVLNSAAMKREISSKQEIKQVATIASESENLGEIISEVMQKVGPTGVVTVEESQSLGIDKEVVEGMEFDKGYVSAYMITNAERMEAVAKDVSILVTDQKISAIKDILPLLEKIAQSGKKELVIIADDVDGEALATFVVNKLRGAFNVLAVKAPGYGDRKKEMLADIATLIGAQVVSEDLGVKLENAELVMLGRAQRVVATKDSTVIVGGKGKKPDIHARVAQLRKQLENIDSKFDKEKLEERIAKLTGGVAVIRVGAATETEMKYLKDKIEDAVNATKAAVAEGIVPGGGVALFQTGRKLNANLVAGKPTDKPKYANNDAAFQVGYATVINACLIPFQEIIRNATHDIGTDSQLIALQIGQKNKGYDAKRSRPVDDMFAEGIIDPMKVTRTALQNAVSAAAIFLTTDAVIADIPEEKKGAGGGMPSGMGDME
ncbi:chaperonin GroL [Candidatus Kaiserbacteria bacterium RIFCSPLOWO2_01_FULL_54_20]|uniref:Chaperonin GroEL n=1 Tax=Candidatus Kaiserbacteria bacterium RIFCSPLOWO2_01_FULL_54_20 TaxID=1798513 RepID=A0A1F6EK06_9BACT|nr:MAG: chaperonin GroL [Candidatus Kaiserbacteria bacterium RIFCSPLOWO2_01_FULL_54_20]